MEEGKKTEEEKKAREDVYSNRDILMLMADSASYKKAPIATPINNMLSITKPEILIYKALTLKTEKDFENYLRDHSFPNNKEWHDILKLVVWTPGNIVATIQSYLNWTVFKVLFMMFEYFDYEQVNSELLSVAQNIDDYFRGTYSFKIIQETVDRVYLNFKKDWILEQDKLPQLKKNNNNNNSNQNIPEEVANIDEFIEKLSKGEFDMKGVNGRGIKVVYSMN